MNKTRIALALAIAALTPAAADATDYCVLPENTCTVANTFPATGTGLQAALTAAGADAAADRVLIGAGTYTAPTNAGFQYSLPAAPVQVIGKGGAQTILTAPAMANPVVLFDGGATSTISDLGIRVPANPGPGFPEAIHLRSTARRVAVTSVAGLVGTNGVVTDGGFFEDGTIDFPMNGPFTGVNPAGNGGGARNTVIHSAKGLQANSDGVSYERLDVTATVEGLSVRGVGAKLQDSIIRMSGNSAAIFLGTGNGTSPTLLANHVTLVGDGTVNSSGIIASASDPGKSVFVDLRNSIISGFDHALFRNASVVGETATITSQYSDYNPAGNLSTGAGGGGPLAPGAGDISAAPQLDGALSPQAGSPVIDKGAPGALDLEPALDRIGNPRLFDGDGDCVARRDMGALERQLGSAPCPVVPDPAPAAPAGQAIQPQGQPAKDIVPPHLTKLSFKKGKLRFTLSEAATVVVQVKKKTKTAKGRKGANTLKLKLGKGRYTAKFTAIDAAGNKSTAKLKIRVR